MTDRSPGRRFRFEGGTITEQTSLDSSKFGLTKTETDLSGYFEDMPSYLERLVGGTSSGSEEDCIFCSFKLDSDNGRYSTTTGGEPLVASVSEHQRLWDDGVVLTYNPNGWHLVNEILFPKYHTKNDDFLESDLTASLQSAFDQWQRHTSGLKSTTVSESDYYHGVVMNLRSGQSISHAHIHCYTSAHTRRDFNDQRIPLFSIEANSWRALSTAVPFDHPRLEFSISEIPAGGSFAMPEVMSILALAAKQTYEDLMGTVPPMSLGWFTQPTTGRYTILIHPMQRRGTVQAFQSVRLHKFDKETVNDTLCHPLQKNISSMIETEPLEYERE